MPFPSRPVFVQDPSDSCSCRLVLSLSRSRSPALASTAFPIKTSLLRHPRCCRCPTFVIATPCLCSRWSCADVHCEKVIFEQAEIVSHLDPPSLPSPFPHSCSRTCLCCPTVVNEQCKAPQISGHLLPPPFCSLRKHSWIATISQCTWDTKSSSSSAATPCNSPRVHVDECHRTRSPAAFSPRLLSVYWWDKPFQALVSVAFA